LRFAAVRARKIRLGIPVPSLGPPIVPQVKQATTADSSQMDEEEDQTQPQNEEEDPNQDGEEIVAPNTILWRDSRDPSSTLITQPVFQPLAEPDPATELPRHHEKRCGQPPCPPGGLSHTDGFGLKLPSAPSSPLRTVVWFCSRSCLVARTNLHRSVSDPDRPTCSGCGGPCAQPLQVRWRLTYEGMFCSQRCIERSMVVY
jgi:hypothetical protein